MNLKEINPEVFFATDRIVTITGKDIKYIENQAQISPRRRARICTHKTVEDKLHEMTVFLKKNVYLIPEKHIIKIESYHIIEGLADVVMFDEDGNVTDVIKIGDYSSGLPFYFRVSEPSFYHTMLIRTDYLIYHEVATGPFQKSDTIVASWAPSEDDTEGIKIYMNDLEHRVKNHLNS